MAKYKGCDVCNKYGIKPVFATVGTDKYKLCSWKCLIALDEIVKASGEVINGFE